MLYWLVIRFYPCQILLVIHFKVIVEFPKFNTEYFPSNVVATHQRPTVEYCDSLFAYSSGIGEPLTLPTRRHSTLTIGCGIPDSSWNILLNVEIRFFQNDIVKDWIRATHCDKLPVCYLEIWFTNWKWHLEVVILKCVNFHNIRFYLNYCQFLPCSGLVKEKCTKLLNTYRSRLELQNQMRFSILVVVTAYCY